MSRLFAPGSAAGWLAAFKMAVMGAAALGLISQIDASSTMSCLASIVATLAAAVVNLQALRALYDHWGAASGGLPTVPPRREEFPEFPRAAVFVLAALAGWLMAGACEAQGTKAIVNPACFGQQQQKTDPALMAVLNQILALQQQAAQASQANQQAILSQLQALQMLLVKMQTAPATPQLIAVPSPGPALLTAPHAGQMISVPQGQIYIPPAGSAAPIIHIPAPGAAPPIVMAAPGTAPLLAQPIPGPGAAPPIVLPPAGKGAAPPIVIPMPGSTGGPTMGYQSFSKTRAVWPPK